MKIICVGRNYGEHIKELGNEAPEAPVIFLKPDTALLKDNQPFVLPPWSQDMHHEIELVLKIGRVGKFIGEKFATKYISHYTVGIDFTARDLQSELKKKGLPWEKSKGFDGSAVIGEWLPFTKETKLDELTFTLHKNGELVQEGRVSDMIYPIPQLISHISEYFTLKTGDILYTGTPKGVGPVQSGDVLVGRIGERELFNFRVR
jgi:2-keto-4-pentenoate hydratase/2-oxohepta-3-ene-1,7-dioic acid hydratase in catechol pathway